VNVPTAGVLRTAESLVAKLTLHWLDGEVAEEWVKVVRAVFE